MFGGIRSERIANMNLTVDRGLPQDDNRRSSESTENNPVGYCTQWLVSTAEANKLGNEKILTSAI
jgi:hypothetical protein